MAEGKGVEPSKALPSGHLAGAILDRSDTFRASYSIAVLGSSGTSGVGLVLGVGVGLGVSLGVGLSLGVGVALGVSLGVGVGLTVGVGLGVGVGLPSVIHAPK